jgi:hypothetical protein
VFYKFVEEFSDIIKPIKPIEGFEENSTIKVRILTPPGGGILS